MTPRWSCSLSDTSSHRISVISSSELETPIIWLQMNPKQSCSVIVTQSCMLFFCLSLQQPGGLPAGPQAGQREIQRGVRGYQHHQQ